MEFYQVNRRSEDVRQYNPMSHGSIPQDIPVLWSMIKSEALLMQLNQAGSPSSRPP